MAARGRKQTGGFRLDTGRYGHYADTSAAPERSGLGVSCEGRHDRIFAPFFEEEVEAEHRPALCWAEPDIALVSTHDLARQVKSRPQPSTLGFPRENGSNNRGCTSAATPGPLIGRPKRKTGLPLRDGS